MKMSADDKVPTERRQPTKKERALSRKRQKDNQRLQLYRRRLIKKILWVTFGLLIIGGGIFGASLLSDDRPPRVESEIISEKGIHWHSRLSITILGQEQDVDANIGLGAVHKPIHTHEKDNIIHLEFSGLVRIDDILLGRFFEIWGKSFSRDCILNQCNGMEGEVRMSVNGEPNFEFENYPMADNDVIEIIFE